jgi:hypothetical protein
MSSNGSDDDDNGARTEDYETGDDARVDSSQMENRLFSLTQHEQQRPYTKIES